MATVIKDLVEYIGINEGELKNFKNFKQLNFESDFHVPSEAPDIEQIVKVYANVDICKYEVIETPIGISLEGQKLTGYKLLVFGDINYKIQYIGDDENQVVQTFKHYIPFGVDIVLSQHFNNLSYITPYAFIEDIDAEQIANRYVCLNLTLLLIADIKA
ncbi:protein of unknown function [Clostridium cavendishii DSM 21758]|uniref:SipL SPOCS domain-containing protein n=1 Tax=Clostridium cavendishii DSM 21758 TaxID=1121302 RepID=A0A1M6JHP4_9CLOT|nr:SPOCS domain-containing protein [Clostridium cavendishii]SHJ46191.1 protein of unknown function [Clostridium cavendishii DSM 21758]